MNNFIFLITLSYLFGAEFKSERQHIIEQQLHAPCCWGGVIAEHDSPKAESIKAIIKNLIDENFDLKLINSSLLATYGNRNILDLKIDDFNKLKFSEYYFYHLFPLYVIIRQNFFLL